jgi:D-3-phosphoglycerate dehydrogenase
MAGIRTYNEIAPEGLDILGGAGHAAGPDVANPDAILLRSYPLLMREVPDTVAAIFRAGAGVDKIPVQEATEKGIVVFNTPGENSNAVAEIALGTMIGLARNVFPADRFVQGLDKGQFDQIESAKKMFVGQEITDRKLAVVGLGAIGVRIANMGVGMGMHVVGFDEFLDVRNAHRLSRRVELADAPTEALDKAHFLTVHVPRTPETTGMVGLEWMKLLSPGAVVLNFARGGIVDDNVVLEALDQGILAGYGSDFPVPEFQGRTDIVMLPHLGASTAEAEINCATTAATQIIDFIGRGKITTSVNFAPIDMAWSGDVRAVILHKDEAGALNHITDPLKEANLNIADSTTRRREQTGVACTLMDIDTKDQSTVADLVAGINDEQVLRVRTIPRPR